MAGRRVEETPQCEIEPRRKPAEILSQFEARRHAMERLSWQKRQHANHARLVAVKNPLRRACKRRTNPRDRKFRIDLCNMEQGASLKVDHRPALGRIADFQDVVSLAFAQVIIAIPLAREFLCLRVKAEDFPRDGLDLTNGESRRGRVEQRRDVSGWGRVHVDFLAGGVTCFTHVTGHARRNPINRSGGGSRPATASPTDEVQAA